MVKAFISYAHTDVHYKDELEKHLATLRRNGEIESWTDTMISPSEVWNESISKSLNTADLIICLISSDFLNSDYCYDIEMRDALIRHREGKAQIIPIIIRPCDWSETPFAHIQVLPTLGKPIREWPDQDQAYVNVVEGIKKAIRAVTQPPAPILAAAAPGASAPVADNPATKPHPSYEHPAVHKGPSTTSHTDYTPGHDASSKKPRMKMTYVYGAAGVILLFVIWRLISGSHTDTDINIADENLEKFQGLTDYIHRFSTQQLVIIGVICAIAGKVVCDFIGMANSLFLNVIIGIIGGFIGLWLFGGYLSVSGNIWINKTLTILVSVLILAFPLKLIKGLFKA